MNFVKFLKTSFFIERTRWLLLLFFRNSLRVRYTTIFSKYAEVLQLRNILRKFFKVFQNKFFKTKIKVYVKRIVYKKIDGWHPVTTSDNKWYNEWQRMTASDNEWRRVVQRVTTNDNEWQRVVQRMTTNDNEWQRVTILANFSFFHIREEPTTNYFKENSLNIENSLNLWRRPIELRAHTSP